ncbi:MAG: hypothetical protein JWM91_2504, partial [Rhodospirillales bacterium]|nr:hypothetical protein [Rhodospirillales bacterium]
VERGHDSGKILLGFIGGISGCLVGDGLASDHDAARFHPLPVPNMRSLPFAAMIPRQIECHLVEIRDRVLDIRDYGGATKAKIQFLHQILRLGFGSQPGSQKPLQGFALKQIGFQKD